MATDQLERAGASRGILGRIAHVAHHVTDASAIAVVQRVRRRPSYEDERRIGTELDLALALFEDRGWIEDPAGYHQVPPPVDDARRSEGSAVGVGYEHLTFTSGYEPWVGEPGRERWLSLEANRTAHALLLRHPGQPRPWLVCLHGAGMGAPALDFVAFRAAWLHRHLGLNVVLPVLPRHGPRRSRHGIEFPTEDVLDTVHGLAQALWDIRRLLGWLRNEGADSIGITGMSLGGYTSALCAAFEADLACVIACIPATDFPTLFRSHLPASRRDEVAYAGEAARRVHRVISPLALECRVPWDRRGIIAGVADRFMEPSEQVVPLWEWWGRPEIHWLPASHVTFLTSRARSDLVGDMLERFGLVGDRS